MSVNIYDLIESQPIEKIIGKYTKVKNSGSNYLTVLSPFSDSAANSMNHMRINRKNNTWFDYSINQGGNAVRFVAMYFNLSNGKAAKKILADSPELFSNSDAKSVTKFKLRHENNQSISKSDSELNMAYKIFLSICLLTKADRKELYTVRHMTDSEIDEYGLFSMPAPTKKYRAKLADKLKKLGLSNSIFYYVPGFYELNGEIFWNYIPGIGIPSRNSNRYITGIQIRTRNPKPDMPRYLWLSSGNVRAKNAKYGHGAGTPISVINSNSNTGEIIITEGFFKGLQYYKKFGVTVAALAGVGNFRDIDKVINSVINWNKTVKHAINPIITIGYDADSLTNPQVLQQEFRLYDKVKELGYKIRAIYWNKNEGKGFDDLVFNHPNNWSQYITLQNFEDFKLEKEHLLNV